MSGLPVAAFDPSRYIGTVCQVDPEEVRVNLPRAVTASSDHHAGYVLLGGQVGEFVLVETDEFALLGRIIEVRLPERERLSVEHVSARNPEPSHPIGTVQLMTSIALATGRVVKGIPHHPSVGQRMFSAHPLLIKHAIEDGRIDQQRSINLATVPHARNTTVSVTPQALLGRHCAVLGATGGGKSWTVARIAEEISRIGGKAILFDATGEYRKLGAGVRHVHLGGRKEGDGDNREFVSFPYDELSELDLFVLFQPSGASQAPKLREALRSLKTVKLQPELAAPNGLLVKATKPRAPIETAFGLHEKEIAAEGAAYDISLLARQINEECIWPTGFQGNANNYGGTNQNELTYCATLVARIGVTVLSPHMTCVFAPRDLPSLPDIIGQFLQDDEHAILRVSLEFLPFEHHTREIVLNAIGRYLLRLARKEVFLKNPTVVLLDEAHQFLNRSLGDEFNRVQLETFGLIAKEGRKYGLTTVLATQRPRDIPDDVLSQMGMFIVHRLISERDRQAVEKACGNMDAAAAQFLPTLGQGEAILVGVDSPMPIPVQVTPPTAEPETHGPDYSNYWVEPDIV